MIYIARQSAGKLGQRRAQSMGMAFKSAHCYSGQGVICGQWHGGQPDYRDDFVKAGRMRGDDSGGQISFS